MILRLLILSDSHGAVFHLKRILQKETGADVVFHLGDGAPDLRSCADLMKDKQTFANKGNCDGSLHHLPAENIVSFENQTVFACHGHIYGVKNSLTPLMFAAMKHEASICLYGHTHIPSIDFRNGIIFVNPGAVYDGRYATIDIFEDKQPYPGLHVINE